MFTLQTSFKPLLFGGGGGVESVSRGDYELQRGNLGLVQEFGLMLPVFLPKPATPLKMGRTIAA